MTTDFKASQVQTSKVIVTGSFAGGSANQLLVYSIDADDSGTPNQGVIDTAVFSTSGIGSDVFLFVSGGIGKVGTPGSYAATVFGGDTRVSGTLFSTSGVFSGDVVVSGTLYAERQVIEVDQFATGTLLVSGNFAVSQSAEMRQGLFVNTSNEAGFGIIVGGNGSFNNQITGSLSQGSDTQAVGSYSHAEGDHTLAKGYVAHSEGYYATGSGDYSHAEGSYTTASGSFSHAEGIYTFSIGEGSHSEGQVTFAEGPRSHAEGFNTHAFGTGSHAEGNFSYAYGTGSHAEGSFATGSGNYSHAEGFHTIASGTHQHVEGRYNLHNNDFSLLIIGNGDDDITRSDVVRVNRGTPGSGSFEVTGTIYTTVGFSGSLTQLTDGRSYLVAGTDISITTASDGQVTIDYIGTGGGGGAQYWDSLQDGAIYSSGSALFRGPAGSNTSPADFGTDTFFYVSGSIGSKDTAVTGTAVFGGDVVISGTLHGGSPLKIGSSLLITGAVSQGSNAQAVGAYSRAGGSNTIAFAGWSVAEGSNSVAAGLYSHANGSNARSGKRAFELQSIGITSVDVVSQPPYAIYKVKNTYTDVTLEFSAYTTIIVFDTASNGGYYDYVDSNYDGTNTYVTASDAYGNGTFFATSADKISNGSYVNQPSADQNAGGDSSHAEGYRAVAVGFGSHAEGEGTVAVGAYSHAEGAAVAIGDYSHAEGENAISSGDNSHAEGFSTIASGTHSHAEGFLSLAKGDYSHAEGRGTQAIGDGSHAEGYATWAIGPWSHAGGLGTFASGAYQTVVGKYNVSQNDTSLFVIGDGIFVIGDGPNSSNRSDIVRVNSGTLPGSGSFEVTGTVRSTLGFSGSLTQLTDGTPYLIAGSGIQTSTGSNGAVTVSLAGTSGLATGKQYVAPYTTATSTTPIAAGQFSWVPADYTGLTSVTVRAIMSTDGTANHTGSLQVYNLTSGSYLDLLDTPTSSKHFIITSSIPTLVTSSNLLTGITNFDNSSTSVYEVRVSGSLTSSTFIGGVEIIFK